MENKELKTIGMNYRQWVKLYRHFMQDRVWERKRRIQSKSRRNKAKSVHSTTADWARNGKTTTSVLSSSRKRPLHSGDRTFKICWTAAFPNTQSTSSTCTSPKTISQTLPPTPSQNQTTTSLIFPKEPCKVKPVIETIAFLQS